MKHLCFKGSIILTLFIWLKAFGLNIAFYYERDIPDEILKFYDYVVIDPDYVDNKTLKYGKKLFAYISVGELELFRNLDFKTDWIIGRNTNWNSYVADIRKKEYKQFLLNRINKLRNKGIKNFFFDTLDSYQISLEKNEWKSYEKELANFIKKVKKIYPDAKIILNRGFEVFDDVYQNIDGVVAESLFRGYDGKKYFNVSQEDRKWLTNKLNYIKSKNVPVFVIDYAKITERELAVKLAQKISNLGFIPYITNKNMSVIGISNIEIFPRKVLIIYYSKEDVAYSNAHRLIQMPLEYFGYICELKTPEEVVKIRHTADRYAGIVVWLENDIVNNYENFYKWILKRIENKNKILFIDYFGFPTNNTYMKPLGLDVEKNLAPVFSKSKLILKNEIVGFEADIPLTIPDNLIKVKKGKPLLILKNSKNQMFHPIAITDWGGYVLQDYSITNILDINRWIINPFEMIKMSLRLKKFPAPDFTTENGMRVLISHIDGDGSVSLSEIFPGKFAMEVIRDEVLKKYKIPIGVSFVEGEIMPYGVYPQYSKKAVEIAKSIFALDNIEPASHTFSHPFKWLKIYNLSRKNIQKIPKGYNLQIPNYRFNLEREIVGSIKVLSKLCPKDKKVNVIYWSGDCVPPKKALQIAYKNNILNINNGDTYITKDFPFLALIAPAGLKRGEYYQIYDGQQNENIYTYEFKHDYWRYKKVIETFELTDKPRRLKPIDIYYHFYSGTKLASLNAVKMAYDYALSQDIIPLKVSEYILKVLDFYNATVARKKDYWIVKTDGNLRTLRANKDLGYPDILNSKGVIGFFEYNNQIYINLDGSKYYKIRFTHDKPYTFYIKQTNGRIKQHFKNSYVIKGYQPIKVVLNNIETCHILSDNEYKQEENNIYFYEKEVDFKVECKQ